MLSIHEVVSIGRNSLDCTVVASDGPRGHVPPGRRREDLHRLWLELCAKKETENVRNSSLY